MIAGEKSIFGQAEMRRFGASDEKGFVLVKSESSPPMRTGDDSQTYSHFLLNCKF
jgi:hypothetical protein